MRTHFKTWPTAVFVIPFLLLSLPAADAADTPSPVEVRSHEFPNGLALYHVRVEEATQFKLSATVWVGSVDEDRKESAGVSHLLEHLLFHQPDMSEIEFNAQVGSRGGGENGETGRDYTRYHVTLPSPHLNFAQKWLYKVLFHDQLVTDRLAEEKEIINRENEWSAPTWWERLWAIIHPDYLELPGFWEHTLGLPKYDQGPGGTYKVAHKLTALQLETHYRAYYYPENMILLYVGPHTLREVVSSVASTFVNARPAGRNPNHHPVVENASPRPYYSHELPFFPGSDYQIHIGHVFTGVRSSQVPALILYQFVLREVLEERLRFGEAKTYSVSSVRDLNRGAGFLQFSLEASPDTYWQQLRDVKDIVWGDLEKHLSQEDYERYKGGLLAWLAATREVDRIHSWIWEALRTHPAHRPAPEEATLSEAWSSISYREFLDWSRAWRKDTAPLLKLAMPVVPFPHAHLVLFVSAIGMGVKLGRSVLRRPFPRRNVKLITRIPYGVAGCLQLGLFYAVVAGAYFHLAWGITYSTLFIRRIYPLAMVGPYLEKAMGGLVIGLAVVVAGLIMHRKVLVTDGALVLEMRSPRFFRIPLKDIEAVEPVRVWKAWERILRLQALPLYPWFFRGLLIHRKSGRPVLLHTKDDDEIRVLLSSHMKLNRAVAKANSLVESGAPVSN
jgi:predicted Zn-dependent peptidase